MKNTFFIILLFFLEILFPLKISFGVEIDNLYQVEVDLRLLESSSEESAYRFALNESLIRVTGNIDINNNDSLDVIFNNPIRYVLQQQKISDSILSVTLDGVAIEKILDEIGISIWDSDRPLTIIWIAIDRGLGDREIVGAEEIEITLVDGTKSPGRNFQLQELFLQEGYRLGIPIMFPLLDIEDLQNIDFIDVWGGFDSLLLEASSRYQAPSILVGRIRADNQSFEPRWTWYMGDERKYWRGKPEEIIKKLATSIANRDLLIKQRVDQSLELIISGINSFEFYAHVDSYINNVRGLKNVSLKTAVDGRVIYAAEFKGDLERLRSVLVSSGILEEQLETLSSGSENVEITEDNSILSLYYRYRIPRTE